MPAGRLCLSVHIGYLMQRWRLRWTSTSIPRQATAAGQRTTSSSAPAAAMLAGKARCLICTSGPEVHNRNADICCIIQYMYADRDDNECYTVLQFTTVTYYSLTWSVKSTTRSPTFVWCN